MRRLIALSLLCLVCYHSDASLGRDRRYLVFPKPGNVAPTKVQMIIGLGLPMEVDVSLIIGYVMKFNYYLPYNVSYLTEPYVRYERSIKSDTGANENGGQEAKKQGGTGIISRWEIYEILESLIGDSRSGKACMLRAICEASAAPFNNVHGLTSQFLRILLTPSTTSEPFRTDFDRVYRAAEIMGRQAVTSCDSLFPECPESPLDYFTELIFGLGTPLSLNREDLILGLFAKFVWDLPSNASDFTLSSVYYARTQKSRWSIYKMLEKVAGLYGFGGKECLLKAICEAASAPFDGTHGLLGQLLHVFFTPSSTDERYDEYGDREYRAAERLGEQMSTENCHALYPECRRSVLDVFSTVIT
ncbi:uncharacterized protein LOC143430678 [Xylocopa sonorina]|uniref:uncharacterized protein LOC143430678 n=1 Tax=Xylocopa sonorina TaxID=1818115 RepID=UPI00403A92A8